VNLLSVPNFSDGRDTAVIAAIRAALDANGGLLDRHSDREHNRSVYTVAGEDELVDLLADSAQVAVRHIDMRHHRGLHPCIGALDVCPLVWLRPEDEQEARALARQVGARIAELLVPVFFYGVLAESEQRRERAYFRKGGLPALRERMAGGEVTPDIGPAAPHPTAGATLVTARPPLAAFNVELDAADPVVAQRVAAALREAGGGPPGVRAIGLPLEGGRSQVSTNVHDPFAVPLRMVVERVTELAAEQGAKPVVAEIVGLVPQAALQGFPQELPIRGFDPEQHVIERRR